MIIFFSLITIAMGISPAPAQARGENHSVGLVLSGGGAKGIAHIGVIKALTDNNIPIDYITGTSMGAIVGGLYSISYTPEEMIELILSEDFSYWSTGTINPRLRYFFTGSERKPIALSVPIGRRDSSDAVPQSLISPLPMNFAFMELFAPYTAQSAGNFDRLMLPFRCVASDVEAKRKVVFSHGSVGDAIRASMSFPAVFAPTEIDGSLLYDGGIYDNFPVDVMRRDFAPGIMIGVDVSQSSNGPQTSIVDQLSNMVIQNNDYNLPADEGIKMRINLDRFSLLDFAKAREIYQIGYDHAMSMMDSIKSRVTARSDSTERALRRAVFKSHTPYLRFASDGVSVTGGTRHQNEFIQYLFEHQRKNKADTFGINDARRAYYMALSTGKLNNLTVQADYNDSTDLFDLSLRASVKRDISVGFGGYITSSSNSYLFFNAAYSTLSFHSVGADVNAWVGQSYMAASASGRLFLPTAVPSMVGLEAVAVRRKFYENDYLFYEDRVPTFIIARDYFGRLKWSLATGYLGKIEVGAGYGHLIRSFYNNNAPETYRLGRDKARYNLYQAYAAFSSNTLDDINFPTRGASYTLRAMGFTGRYNFEPASAAATAERSTPRWVQAEIATRNYLTLGRHWSLGLESDIMLSTRKLHGNYDASIITAPDYAPTPASNNTFNPAFRANSFIAAAIVPVYRFNDNLSARVFGSGFLPVRKILEDSNGRAFYGRHFASSEFYGEFDVTYRFPFAALSGYVNYSTYPARNWNAGISLGIYLTAPKFIR